MLSDPFVSLCSVKFDDPRDEFVDGFVVLFAETDCEIALVDSVISIEFRKKTPFVGRVTHSAYSRPAWLNRPCTRRFAFPNARHGANVLSSEHST